MTWDSTKPICLSSRESVSSIKSDAVKLMPDATLGVRMISACPAHRSAMARSCTWVSVRIRPMELPCHRSSNTSPILPLGVWFRCPITVRLSRTTQTASVTSSILALVEMLPRFATMTSMALAPSVGIWPPEPHVTPRVILGDVTSRWFSLWCCNSSLTPRPVCCGVTARRLEGTYPTRCVLVALCKCAVQRSVSGVMARQSPAIATVSAPLLQPQPRTLLRSLQLQLRRA